MSGGRLKLPQRIKTVVRLPRSPVTTDTEDFRTYEANLELRQWEAVERIADATGASHDELWKARDYLLDFARSAKRGRPIKMEPNRVLVAAQKVNTGCSLTKAAKQSGIAASTLKDFANRRPEMWNAICEIAAIEPQRNTGRK